MLFTVYVKFQKDFVEIDRNEIKIGIKSRPIKGKANKEIIKKLTKHFGISDSQITIKSGHKSKIKLIEILS